MRYTKSVWAVLLLLAAAPAGAQCLAAPPSVTTQTALGAAIGYEAGFDEQINLIIRNNNTPACAEETFDVTAEPYNAGQMAGWRFDVRALGAHSLSGQVSAAAVHVISPLTAAPGFYTWRYTVTARSAPVPVIGYLGSVVIPTGSVCTTSPPIVSLAPAIMTDVRPGLGATFTVSVKNANGIACIQNAFDLTAATTPPNLAATFLGADTPTIGAGLTGQYPLSVVIPPTMTTGSIAVRVTATQHDAPLSVGTGAASIALLAPPQLIVSAMTDKPNYPKSTVATITVTVTDTHGQPQAGAQVFAVVTEPNGQSHPLNAVRTDATGRASTTFTLVKKAPSGMYQVLVNVILVGAQPPSSPTVFAFAVK